MATPLLRTKLHVPPYRPELVPRPSLIQRLDAGIHRKLTLVSAPAGFGKTTLLSEWAHHRSESTPSLPIAWLSLDEGDNDPARFLAYLIAALETIGIQLDKVARQIPFTSITTDALGAFRDSQPPPAGVASRNEIEGIESVLTILINEITSTAQDDRWGLPFVLVLDDCHRIEAQPVHSALTFLLDNLPGSMHLVIATRSDPPLKLSRLRGRGQLNELRQVDLRFTPDEVAEFLNRVTGWVFSPDDVTVLASRTEGWIAGLQMTAIALNGEWLVDNGHRASGATAPQRLITEQFLQVLSGSQRFVLDYLMEEVLERQPRNVRSFLLQTSVLDLLTGPLCETVTGQDDGQAMLDKMERRNLFIVSLDKERRWYRYHRLFAGLLRRRVHQMQPEHVPILHRRASEWYEHHGLTAAAVEHALSAQDFERAARLIDGLADTLWQHSEHTTLSRWLEAMPEEVMRSRPGLCIFHACVLFMAGHHHAAEQRLRAAEATLGLTMALAPALGPDQVQDSSAMVQQGRVAAIRALLASFRGDVPAIIQFSGRALEVLPEEEAIWRGFVALALGTAHTFRGELAQARQAYSAAVAAGEAAGHTHLVLNATIRLALNQWHQGRLRQAGEICRQGLQLVEESGFSHAAAAGALYALWGQVLCEWNDLDNAMQYVQRGLEVSERGVSAGGLGFSYLALVRVLFAERRLAAAEDMIERLDKSVRGLDVPVWITSAIAAWKVWIWTVQGRLTAAQQLVRERGLSVTDDIVFPRAAEYVSLARLLIAQGELEAAIGLLECMLQSAEAESREGWTVQMLALRALALEARGDDAGAMDSLERALDLAEPQGCVRVFVDEGPSMARLLYAAAARGIAPQYTGRLLATFPESDLALSVTEPPKLQMIEPLSARELEVLQLIAEGLTNREIAQRLYLALSTVKVHNYRIYGKLGVHTRMQAVAKARSLGILPPS